MALEHDRVNLTEYCHDRDSFPNWDAIPYSGLADDAVAGWLGSHLWEIDESLARQYLKGVGLDPEDVDNMDLKALASYLVWMRALDIQEQEISVLEY